VCRRLFHGLLRYRVKPYYLYQADLVVGTSHFRTTTSKGLEIIAGLRGHTTGYAVPTYAIDVPGGGGKIAVLPDSQIHRDDGHLLLRNYEDRVFRFPDPQR
jgi:lysine 2,3-aminomutase